MLWLYVAVGTAGLVMIVPAVLQAIDGHTPGPIFGSAAFAATAFGVAGAFADQFSGGAGVNLVASVAVGLAAGAVHPEVLKSLGPESSPSAS